MPAGRLDGRSGRCAGGGRGGLGIPGRPRRDLGEGGLWSAVPPAESARVPGRPRECFPVRALGGFGPPLCPAESTV